MSAFFFRARAQKDSYQTPTLTHAWAFLALTRWDLIYMTLAVSLIITYLIIIKHDLLLSVLMQLFTWGWNQRGTLGHAPGSKTECMPSQVKTTHYQLDMWHRVCSQFKLLISPFSLWIR